MTVHLLQLDREIVTLARLYIAYGVKSDNRRELLTLEINPTEGSNLWGEMFDELKNKRGVEKVDLIIADGIKFRK